MSSTLTRPKTNLADAGKVPNGLGILQRFVNDPNLQPDIDAINREGAEIGDEIRALFDRRDHMLMDDSWGMTIRTVCDAAEEYQSDKRQLRERLREHKTQLQAKLPELMPGCKRQLVEQEQAYGRVIDMVEEQSREIGVNEFSYPGGEHAGANMQGARERFRERLGQDEAALNAMARWNIAKESQAVLKSMLAIVVTDGIVDSYFRSAMPQTTLPSFIVKLFS